MSGNINDTNVSKLQSEIVSLINKLDNLIKTNTSIEMYESKYQLEYKYLFNTSKTLWNYIFTQYKNSTFDKSQFQKNLDMMLSTILKIQTAQLSQHQGSTIIGEEIASQYIPQLKK
jgi:hypothetical protein